MGTLLHAPIQATNLYHSSTIDGKPVIQAAVLAGMFQNYFIFFIINQS